MTVTNYVTVTGKAADDPAALARELDKLSRRTAAACFRMCSWDVPTCPKNSVPSSHRTGTRLLCQRSKN